MTSRKFVIGGIVIGSLLLMSIPIAPLGPACPKGAPSLCGLISNVVLVIGGAMVLKSEVGSRLLPGTPVLVELDNGEIKTATLTRKATDGRPIKNGDKVRLNCLKSYPSPENTKLRICELEFLGFDHFSACTKGSPCYGKIPSWSIDVDEQGNPDSELVHFH